MQWYDVVVKGRDIMNERKSIFKASFAASIIGLVFVVMLSSCEGEGASCRSHDDCGSDLFCYGPNRPNVCGIPPREQCWKDADCPMGTLCHTVFDHCSLDGIGSECKPPCIADSCGPDFRCNASGACEPIPCDEGFTCPDRQTCDAMLAHDATLPVHARTSGCVNIACSADGACPTGKFCVEGYCQDELGTCGEEFAVP